MAETEGNGDAGPDADDSLATDSGDEGPLIDPLAVASFALSAIGFLTLLRLADRRERSPAAGLGLFLATTLESTGGTALGLIAAGRNKDPDRLTKGFLVAAGGAVLPVVTTLMNFNWMRTRRRL
jgi:hypothetical protein